jgi:DNA primase
MAKWVDFDDVKRRMRYADVAQHYKLQLVVKGDQATGACPVPTHEGEGKSSSFSFNISKGIWQCFGCGAKGNILHLAVYLEGGLPEVTADVRTTAVKWDAILNQGLDRPRRFGKVPAKPTVAAPPAVVNEPLDFELKDLDYTHPYFRDRGFKAKTLERFGVGYCSRGLMAGRQVIPIHDDRGKLVAYCGRLVDDSLVDKDNPKYLFPPKREKDGSTREFRKSLVLYNANRIIEPATSLVIVEGFPSVWWLWQHGFHDAVALMGASCSEEQARITLRKVPQDGIVLVLSDGDEAGERCALSVFNQVGTERPVRWVNLPVGTQPTGMTRDGLESMLRDY